MQTFHCNHCQNLVFFENTTCVQCGHFLAFLPDRHAMSSLRSKGGNLWLTETSEQTYRLCKNYETEKVCNWAVPEGDPNPYCASCRLTRVIPDLKQAGHREAWQKLEAAKRRLIYGLHHLHLMPVPKTADTKNGLAFEFLADHAQDGQAKTVVLTGHNDGCIVINIAEADDSEREKRRLQMYEPYRTLLGHFRHEVGHYYWDRLIKDSPHLDGYRSLFGDERNNYDQALQTYYKNGAPKDWQLNFISAYATAHPWEDWAESWAHYFHMTDALETAEGCGLFLRPQRPDEPALKPTPVRADGDVRTFKAMVDAWFPLTYVLNNLNRGMGLADGYPFLLSEPVLAKLSFIHTVIGQGEGQHQHGPQVNK